MSRPSSAPPRSLQGPRVPLRVTLVALLVALLAVSLAITGLTATSLLKDYLLDQRDAQLRALAQTVGERPWAVLDNCRSEQVGYPANDYIGCIPPEGDDGGAATGEAALTVVSGPVDDEGRLPDFGRATDWIRDRAADDPGPLLDLFTVPAENGDTSWRVAAIDLPEGYTALLGIDLAGDEKVIARLVRIVVVVGLIVLAVLGTAGYLLVRNSLRPLTEVEHTAQAIAAGDLSRRVPEGDDRTEVGRLSLALNGMLARIESAFRAQQSSEAEARASESRMRRFVADASHELRTPLTSIRGFAELYRQGAVGSEDDVRRLMQRIEAEGGRMGLLVEDLLLLARMDQQRPLSSGPVDLAAVAGDAVHDARAVQPDRPISLHLDESLTDVPVVRGDEARLRQVLANLVGNALTHTPPDARVTVSVAQDPDPGFLAIRVADEGPGMDPADADRAFERFYRADASRNRAAGGTGLGLAIVSSLVAAHGGSVRLETAPGKGAAFTVRLPVTGPPTPPRDGGADGEA